MSLPPKQRVSPLNWREPIVNPDGTPSQQFIRLWQTMFGNGENVDAEVQQLIDAQIQAGSGIAITPNGHLLSNPTIAAEVQPILDQITDVHGSVLYRDSTGWAHLPPGTAGQFLQTQGAGADPLWAAGGGGGGGYFSGFSNDPTGATTFTTNFAGRGIPFTVSQTLNITDATFTIAASALTQTFVAHLVTCNTLVVSATTPVVTGLLGASAPVTATTTDPNIYRFTFASPVTLNPATDYMLMVFRTDSTGTASNRVRGVASGCEFNCPANRAPGCSYYSGTAPVVSMAASNFNATTTLLCGMGGTL